MHKVCVSRINTIPTKGDALKPNCGTLYSLQRDVRYQF